MRRARAASAALAAVALVTASYPTPAAAQFEAPCELACAAVLGATSFVTATGVSIAVGRMTGGLDGVDQGLLLWGASFAATAGGGMALSGNGQRQQRAIYAAGIGTLIGALAGGAAAAARRGDEAHLIVGTLVGAAAGAMVGGVVGAFTYDAADGGALPLFTVRLPL